MAEHITNVPSSSPIEDKNASTNKPPSLDDGTSATEIADKSEKYEDEWPNTHGAGGVSTTRARTRVEKEKAERNKGIIGEEEKNIEWPMPFTDSPLIEGPSTDEGKLLSRIKMYGIKEIPVEMDGNTQFRALARLMYDKEMAHTFVRKKTYEELVNHPEQYERKFHEIFGMGNYKDYCENVSRICKEGDLVSLAAASSAFHVKISLMRNTEDDFIVEFIPKDNVFRKELLMSLVYDNMIYKACIFQEVGDGNSDH